VNAQRLVAVGRLSRAALFAAGAAGLALATTDCGEMATASYGGFFPVGVEEVPVEDGGDAGQTLVLDAGFGGVPTLTFDATPAEASVDAERGDVSAPAAADGEAGTAEGGSDGAVVPPTDGAEDGH